MVSRALAGAFVARALKSDGRGGPNFASGKIGSAAADATPTATDIVTDAQAKQLRLADLAHQQQYLEELYALKANEIQRELTLDDKRHEQGRTSDAAYFAQREGLEERAAAQHVELIDKEIAKQREAVRIAKDLLYQQIGKAQSGDATDPNAVVAAREASLGEEAKLNALTVKRTDAEKALGATIAKRGQLQYDADKKATEDANAITRAQQDYLRGIDQQIEAMQLSLDLVGKDEVATKQANFQHDLENKFAERRIVLLRELQDLQNKPGDHSEEIARTRQEIDELGPAMAAALSKGKTIIRETFSRSTWAAGWTDLMNGVNDVFKAGYDAIVSGAGNTAQRMKEAFKRTFFDWIFAQFAKPIFLNVIASVAGAAGLSGAGHGATTARSQDLGNSTWSDLRARDTAAHPD